MALDEKIKSVERRRKKQEADTRRLERDRAKCRSLACEYQEEYEKLMGSKVLKFWFDLRQSQGKGSKRAALKTPKRAQVRLAVSPSALRLGEELEAFAQRFAETPAPRATEKAQALAYVSIAGKAGALSAVAGAVANADDCEAVVSADGIAAVLFDASEASAKDFRAADTALASVARACDAAGKYLFVVMPDTRPEGVKQERAQAFEQTVERLCEAGGVTRVSRSQLGFIPERFAPVGMFGREGSAADECRVLFPAFGETRADEDLSAELEELLAAVFSDCGVRPVLDDAKGFTSARKSGKSFPRKYDPYLIPSVSEEALACAPKICDFAALTAASTHEATQRAWELQAMGCVPVYGRGAADEVPLGGILLDDEDAVALSELSRAEVNALRIEAVRRAYSAHTVYDSLNALFASAGLAEPFPAKSVYVVCEDPAIVSAFEPVSGMRVVSEAEVCALASASGYLIRLNADAASCGRFFLVDAVNALKFADVDFVRATHVFEESYCYVAGALDAWNCLYDSSKVSASDVFAGRVDKALSGFAVFASLRG